MPLVSHRAVKVRSKLEERITLAESLQDQAEGFLRQAREFERAGRAADFLDAMHSAVLCFAAADSEREAPDEAGPLTRPRAEACRRYAEALAADGHHAQAANIYQEATDLYGLLGDPQSQELASDCAKKLLASLAALRSGAGDRLQLLIARYERQQQQLALTPGSELQQAECAIHIARIYQRRDRPAESADRYRDALELLNRIEPAPESERVRAECHHRIATLFAERLDEPFEAIRYYQTAIDLYELHEVPVYGVQNSCEFCRSALARLKESLRQQDNGLKRRSQD
jgi:tetratricopeptide (TPR) repeat protein